MVQASMEKLESRTAIEDMLARREPVTRNFTRDEVIALFADEFPQFNPLRLVLRLTAVDALTWQEGPAGRIYYDAGVALAQADPERKSWLTGEEAAGMLGLTGSGFRRRVREGLIVPLDGSKPHLYWRWAIRQMPTKAPTGGKQGKAHLERGGK